MFALVDTRRNLYKVLTQEELDQIPNLSRKLGKGKYLLIEGRSKKDVRRKIRENPESKYCAEE